MIDLKKLKSNAEYLEKTCDGAYVELPTADVLELISLLEQAQKDAARLDWIESRSKINSKGSRQVGFDVDRHAIFTVLPSWYQRGVEHDSLRSSIDAAMQSEKGE